MTDPTSPPPAPRDPTSPLPASQWPAADPWPAAGAWPEESTPPGSDPAGAAGSGASGAGSGGSGAGSGGSGADSAGPDAAGGGAGGPDAAGAGAGGPDQGGSDLGLVDSPLTWEPPTMPATWAGSAPIPAAAAELEPTRAMPASVADDGPVVAYLGEIAVTSTTVHTPAGPIPLRGSQWTVTDQWLAQQRTPTWAVLAAIFGFCFIFLFSLLFLIAKETVYVGTVQIVVTNGRQQYVARIPVATHAQVQHLHQQANYVRSLAAL
jgi:hypothetical protein